MDLGHKPTSQVLYGSYAEEEVFIARRGVIIVLPRRLCKEATRIFNKASEYYERTFNTDTYLKCVEKVIDEENWDFGILTEEQLRWYEQ